MLFRSSIPQQRVNIEAMKAGMSMIEPLYDNKGQIVGYRNKFTGQPISQADLSKYIGGITTPSATVSQPPSTSAKVSQPPSTTATATGPTAPIKKTSEQPSAAPAPTQGPPAAPTPPVATEKPAYLIPSAPFRTPDEARAAALSNPQVAAYHSEAEKWQNEINDTQRALQGPQ